MRRCGKRLLILTLCGICMLPYGCALKDNLYVDCYSLAQFKKLIGPVFDHYIMNVKAGNKSRIDVYVQMPFRHLRFEKTPDGFRASYDYSFVIKDSEQQVVQMKEIERLVETKTYEESVSQRWDLYLQSFTINPGQYSLEIVSIDNTSHLQYRTRQRIEAKDYSIKKILSSTELFLDTVVTDENGITLRPVIPSSLSWLSSSMGMFQEFYNVHKGDTITIMQTYSFPKIDTQKEESNYHALMPYRIGNALHTNDNDSIYYKNDSTFVASNDNNVRMVQFYPLPALRSSVISRSVIFKENGRSDTTITQWPIFRRVLKNQIHPMPDEIIASLKYIMKPYEYDSILIADEDVRCEKIKAFWDTHGYFQSSQDFERRVNEADELFISCIEGSKTPMGIVYVICGAPSYIDCHNYFVESWYYVIGKKTFSIQFRRVKDITHFRYFEVVPFSINESMWQYYVDRWRKK